MRIERTACIAGPCLVLLTAGLLATGCVGPPVRAASPERRVSDAGVAPGEIARPSARGASRPRTPPQPDARLTLEEALKRALEESPELASRSWELQGQEARAIQAGLAPNPELQAETENFAGSGGAFSGFGASETTLALAQRIETAGKRQKRRRAAELGGGVAAWDVAEARLRVIEQVTGAFAGVVAAQQAVSVTAEQVEIAESSQRATRGLVDAGAAPPVEATRDRVAVATARIDRVRAVRELEATRVELARTWGSATADFAGVVGEAGAVMAPPAIEDLRALLSHNPALAAWDQEVARREALVELEDARRVPDVTAAAGVRWLAEPEDAALVAGFSVPLPLFDRNQGERAAARADLRRARSERRAEEAALGTELERAYQELAARHEEIVELREEALPAARDAFDGVRDGYRRGLFRNTDVLEAQHTLVGLRLREIDAVRAYHVARAALERLTAGAPVQP